MRVPIVFLFLITLASACKDPFSDHYYLEEQICLNLWHNTIIAKKNESNKDGFAEFASVCPTWKQNIKLNYKSEELGHTDNQKAFKWGTKIDLYDCTNEIFAIIKEGDLNVVLNQREVKTSFNIYEPDGKTLIGYSDKNEFLSTEITIRNLDGIKIAYANKTTKSKIGVNECINPEWELRFYNMTSLIGDKRILSFIVALKAMEDISGDGGTDRCTIFYILGIVGGPIFILICGISIIIFLKCNCIRKLRPRCCL